MRGTTDKPPSGSGNPHILDQLYASEINDTFEEACAWLPAAASEHYAESDFALAAKGQPA